MIPNDVFSIVLCCSFFSWRRKPGGLTDPSCLRMIPIDNQHSDISFTRVFYWFLTWTYWSTIECFYESARHPSASCFRGWRSYSVHSPPIEAKYFDFGPPWSSLLKMFTSKKTIRDWPSKQIWKLSHSPVARHPTIWRGPLNLNHTINPFFVGWNSPQDKTKNSKSGRKSKRRNTFENSLNLGLFSLRGSGGSAFRLGLETGVYPLVI